MTADPNHRLITHTPQDCAVAHYGGVITCTSCDVYRLIAAGDAMRDVARELYMAYSDPYGDSDMHDMYAEANTAWQVARDE